MAKDLAIDPRTMDIAWPPHYVSGRDEVAQALIGLIMTPKGTFINRPDVGMDYTFMQNKINVDEMRLSVNDAIKEDDRVIKIDSIQIKRINNHKIRIYATVETTLGKISFDKEMSNSAIER